MNQLAKILATLIERWTSNSPKLFKTITNISVIIGAVASIVLLMPITIPAWLTVLLGFLIAFSGGFGISSKLTTDDDKIIEKTKEIFKDKRSE
jgi:hypothetical protein